MRLAAAAESSLAQTRPSGQPARVLGLEFTRGRSWRFDDTQAASTSGCRRSELAASRGVGGPAGQHAAGCAPLDARSCREASSPTAGRTRRWCSCGGRGSACTSSPNATERCSPSDGFRTMLPSAVMRSSWRTGSRRSSTAAGCSIGEAGRGARASTPTHCATPPRRAEW